MPIQNFRHKGLKNFFEKNDKSGFQTAHIKKIGLILDLLDSVTTAKEMNFPGSNFHVLKGELNRFYSVHVNGNWSIIFRFEDGDAFDVNLIDYH